MTDRTFASVVSKLSPSVPGCPTQTMIQYLRDSAIRVCERTLAWRYELPKFNLLPGVHEYAFNIPGETSVHAIFGAHLNDYPMERLNLEKALELYPAWANLYSGESPATAWSETDPHVFNTDEFNEEEFNAGDDYVLPEAIVVEGSTPRSICQVRPDRYIVLPLPDDQTYAMRMFVALKPTRIATGMDVTLLDELEDVIVHGALQQLHTLPSTHWGDKDLAAYHSKQYLFHLSERRARANVGNVRASLIAQSPRFA